MISDGTSLSRCFRPGVGAAPRRHSTDLPRGTGCAAEPLRLRTVRRSGPCQVILCSAGVTTYNLSMHQCWAAGHDDTSCQKPRTDGCGCPSRMCDYCLRTSQGGGGGGRGEGGQPLLRCARSKLARYCSREHQAEAWRKGGYQSECKALVAGSPRVPPPTVRLAARVLWRRLRCEGRWILQDTM